MRIKSFASVTNRDTEILILGSMPGVKSLERNQYYGHAQNHFWAIIAALTGNETPIDYKRKLQLLKRAKMGVWDVIESCERVGSRDDKITAEKPNDFRGFYDKHPQLQRVIFNGKKAEATYRKFGLPRPEHIAFVTAPSTSPLNTMPRAEKQRLWAEFIK